MKLKRVVMLLLAGLLLAACTRLGGGADPADNGAAPLPGVRVLMREVTDATRNPATTRLPWNGAMLALAEPPFVQTEDIEALRLDVDANGQPVLMARFTDEAAPRIQQATTSRIGRRVALTVDGRVITVATVAGSFGHSMQFSGGGPAETRELYRQITGKAAVTSQ